MRVSGSFGPYRLFLINSYSGGEIVHKVQPDKLFVHGYSHLIQCGKQFHDLADDDGMIFTRLKASAKNPSAKEELRSLGFCTMKIRDPIPTSYW